MVGTTDIGKRLQDWQEISNETWSSFDVLGPGIHLYHDVLPIELNIIPTLESYLHDNPDSRWEPAMVGYGIKIPEYRDCYDFKFKSSLSKFKIVSPREKMLIEMYDATYARQLQAVKHYCGIFGVGEVRYWEATNFVKYGKGQHFATHTDHGYSYNCTVSLVAFANDDFEGGELEFSNWGLTLKPKAGDLVVFPSNYMYPHRSLPVIEGTKYSLVTMLDYSDKFHKQKFYQETGT